jgi:hypothetical protein
MSGGGLVLGALTRAFTGRRGVVIATMSALVVAALPAIAATAAPSNTPPVTGAAFTTVNTSVDGDGHCANGNPAVNCNIYDAPEHVWLNGGPSTAYVGPGEYFFAVLEPGGQADPNDGTGHNLSDDFDSYQNRTFTVGADNSVTYGGTHDFDSNKIRLSPYTPTSNPGGVHILAICSLAKGYEVSPARCKYDAFKVGDPGYVPDPAITKDAIGVYTQTFHWTIAKAAAAPTKVMQAGGSATFHYTVTVGHDAGDISGVGVAGTITVTNFADSPIEIRPSRSRPSPTSSRTEPHATWTAAMLRRRFSRVTRTSRTAATWAPRCRSTR